jgi:hypothetical protein
MLLSGCLILHDVDSYEQTGGLFVPINKKKGEGYFRKKKSASLNTWSRGIQPYNSGHESSF